eukprot:COSAG01_NODE_1942_length_8842_cov_5.900492_3_plen_287_part_00
MLEELDSPSEWFYDAASKRLFLWPYATDAATNKTVPPPDGDLIAVWLPMLVNLTATQDNPARDVAFVGVGFRDAAYSYMLPHGMPGAGDWNLQRHAALFAEGTERVHVRGCSFERLDGNAVAISGYSRNATVVECDFAWIGDSCIISWGYTTGSPIVGMGPNATDGNHPQHNQIVGNFARELGIWQKQSSFYFQDRSAFSNVRDHGPRSPDRAHTYRLCGMTSCLPPCLPASRRSRGTLFSMDLALPLSSTMGLSGAIMSRSALFAHLHAFFLPCTTHSPTPARRY